MPKATGLRSFAFTVLIALSLLFVSTATWAATTGNLQGTVRSVSGTPLARANVFLVGTGLGTTTDTGGHYTFAALQPDTYTVRTQFAGYVTQNQQVTITQDQTAVLDFSLRPSGGGGRTLITIAPVRRTQTATATVITAETEQKVKSNPNNLYQFPGLVFGQPGISYDPGGYVHIRGSDQNQVGFALDGINLSDPIDNQFATNIVTVGLKSANFYTGGADASYGNATGGYINEITQSGRDLRGGIVEGTFGPSQNYQYLGTNSQYGNVTPDGKFDYYATTLRFRSRFPQQFGVIALPDSQDSQVKFNYYADKNNTVTAQYAYGLEHYDYVPGTGDPPVGQIDEGTGNLVQVPGSNTGQHEVQHYEIATTSFQHRFSPTSTTSFRYYRIFQPVIFHSENVNGLYEKTDFTTNGYQLDYTNQFSRAYRLQAGLYYLDSSTNFHEITGATAPFDSPNNPLPGYYVDRSNVANPKQTVLYLTNELRPLGDKFTLNLGVRFANDRFDNLKRLSNFSDSYADPRIGATYSPTRDLVFRASYARYSQFPGTRFLEYDSPEQSGIFPITAVPGSAAAQRTFINNRYIPNPLSPSYSDNVDLGVEKSFSPFGNRGFLGGTYAFTLTGFSKKQRDLLQLEYNTNTLANVGLAGPRYFDNAGKGQATGVEFVLTKRARNAGDINGFVSYTNEVIRATSSFFDTGYIPYFANIAAGSGVASAADFTRYNNQEFPTSYAQRHTVAAVVTKRFGAIEPSLVFDAGSGFPFSAGASSDNPIQTGIDGQHGGKTFGAGEFTEVPVLAQGNQITALNPALGQTGWHYQFNVNTNFYLTPETNLFLNVANIFDRLTVTQLFTANYGGQIYYRAPTAQQPQGSEYYGPFQSLTPIFISFGFRHRF